MKQNQTLSRLAAGVGLLAGLTLGGPLHAQTSGAPGPAALEIDAAHPGPRVSPMLYGLMTEEINYSYDGGLYGELIQNRAFKNDLTSPVHWALVQDGGGAGTIALDTTRPLSAALPTSLKLSVTTASARQRVGIANDGYWGIPVKPGTRYHASFYARAADGLSGPLTADIESADGATIYARAQIPQVTADWKQYTVTLTTDKNIAPSAANRFVVSASHAGTVFLNLVSLFPPTYHDTPNGNRIDLMQKLADMRPAFLRMPGGNYLEGNSIPERFAWKDTVGPLPQRPGHQGPWGYRSDDGLGLLEFLEWCEDLHMQPLLAVYAGYSLNHTHVTPGPDLQPYVQDALDEIEYATGAADTRWGAARVRDGHPTPFPIQYVEVGNEDQFDRSGSYSERFAQFYDAIKAKYPRLQVIATTKITGRTPDLVDDHFYRRPQAMADDAHHYDSYPRTGPKVFVGEWASQETARPWLSASLAAEPTPNLDCALGDAAWMTGLERNSDVVTLECYAPLFVNVNPGGRQWATNLIGYDALTSYGSPSYYAQVMFRRATGDVVLPATLTNATTLYESVTRDSKTGTVYLKMVNRSDTAQPVHVTLAGAKSVASTGTAVTLGGADLKDTNSLTEPTKIVPVTKTATGLGTDFTYTFPPYSVTILQMQGR